MGSLYAYAVGLADAVWLCPERALRLFFASVLFVDPVRTLRAVALEEGRLPMRWVPSEPMGFAVAPPISPYTGPGQSPRFGRPPIGAQVGVSYFPARRSACIHGDQLVSLTGLCVSQPKHSHRVVLTLLRRMDVIGVHRKKFFFFFFLNCVQ